VHVFNLGDEAELIMNGRSLGRKRKGPHEYRLRWDDVVYELGTLEVVAYKDGSRWASNRVRTAQKAARFEVEGFGEIVAADNGDPTSFEPFPSPERNAFSGLCLAIVRRKAGQRALSGSRLRAMAWARAPP